MLLKSGNSAIVRIWKQNSCQNLENLDRNEVVITMQCTGNARVQVQTSVDQLRIDGDPAGKRILPANWLEHGSRSGAWDNSS